MLQVLYKWVTDMVCVYVCVCSRMKKVSGCVTGLKGCIELSPAPPGA